MLADEGMSTRAIAPIVGATHTTVRRDIESTGTNVPDEPAEPRAVVGNDGRTRTYTPEKGVTTTDTLSRPTVPLLARCSRQPWPPWPRLNPVIHTMLSNMVTLTTLPTTQGCPSGGHPLTFPGGPLFLATVAFKATVDRRRSVAPIWTHFGHTYSQ